MPVVVSDDENCVPCVTSPALPPLTPLAVQPEVSAKVPLGTAWAAARLVRSRRGSMGASGWPQDTSERDLPARMSALRLAALRRPGAIPDDGEVSRCGETLSGERRVEL